MRAASRGLWQLSELGSFDKLRTSHWDAWDDWDSFPKVAERRSTRSPGWSEAEPWGSVAFRFRSPVRTEYSALAGLWELNYTANPGFRSQARFTLGYEYVAPPGWGIKKQLLTQGSARKLASPWATNISPLRGWEAIVRPGRTDPREDSPIVGRGRPTHGAAVG
jgi:hypothetical protein